MLPRVTIVIPGYNCSATIKNTLEASLNQDYPCELREVIFVDDGSCDNTRDAVGGLPVKYINQEHSGPARARNRGWRQASGEIILFTDSDCVPDSKWISSIIKNFAGGDIGGVGGSYGIINTENLLASCVHAEIIWRHKKMPRSPKALGSYNLAVPKKVLQELNGFDETYLTSSAEDNDLCYRILKKGYRLLFEPEALVYHRHPEELYPYLRHQFRHGFWRMKLYRKHPAMAGGDDYSSFWDYITPLIALLIVGIIPLLFVGILARIELALIISHLLVNSIKAVAITKIDRRAKYIYLLKLIMLRDYWRGIGIFSGIIRFFIASPCRINYRRYGE